MTWEKDRRRQELKASEKWLLKPRHYGDDVDLVVFPGTYGIGIANLGFQFLLGELSKKGRPFDRYFTDPSLPEDRSFDTGRPLMDFRRWDVTLPYEENLLALIKLLLRLNVALDASEREWPILNVGGAMTYINPSLVRHIANDFFAGEADGQWPELRQRSQWQLAKQFGVRSVVISPQGVFGDAFLLELGRGCVWRCSFCLYRAAYGNLRLVPLDSVIASLKWAKEQGLAKIGFVAANVSDVPWIEQVLETTLALGLQLTVSSLAVETLDFNIMQLLRRLGVRQITLGVEHGDENVRKSLGKPYGDDKLVNLAAIAQELGFKSLKLYFINGVTPDPVFNAESAVSLLRRVTAGIGLKVKVSASVFVPKMGTPMANEVFPSSHNIEHERALLLKGLPSVSFSFEPYFDAQKEFVMSRLKPDYLQDFVTLLAKSEKKAIRIFAESMRLQ